MLPEEVNRWDEHFLFRRMDIAQGRAKRNHIKIRIFFQEQTTLKTSMNGFYLWLLIKQSFVAFNCNLQNL